MEYLALNSSGALLSEFDVIPPKRTPPIGTMLLSPIMQRLPFIIREYDVDQETHEVTVREREISAYTFYCDLDADADWDPTPDTEDEVREIRWQKRRDAWNSRNKTGDGSMENPWKNIAYALEKINCYSSFIGCHHQYFRLVCTGTARYPVTMFPHSDNDDFDGIDGMGRIIIDGASFINGGFWQISGCFFYNCTFRYINDPQPKKVYHATPFGESRNSFFYNVLIERSSQQDVERTCFYKCQNSVFDECSITAPEETTISFSTCGESIFLNCSIDCYCANQGISNCDESTFYNCKISVHEQSIVFAYCDDSFFIECTVLDDCNYEERDKAYSGTCSFYNCTSSVFKKCHANRTYKSYGNGFSDIKESEIDGCTAGYGGINADDSIIKNCTVTNGMIEGQRTSIQSCNVERTVMLALTQTGIKVEDGTIDDCNVKIDIKEKSDKNESTTETGFYGSSSTVKNCFASVLLSLETSSYKASATAIGFEFSSDKDSLIDTCEANISAKVKTTPDDHGNFNEDEIEIEKKYNYEKIGKYRCVHRDEDGEEDCSGK